MIEDSSDDRAVRRTIEKLSQTCVGLEFFWALCFFFGWMRRVGSVGSEGTKLWVRPQDCSARDEIVEKRLGVYY